MTAVTTTGMLGCPDCGRLAKLVGYAEFDIRSNRFTRVRVRLSCPGRCMVESDRLVQLWRDVQR